MKKKPTPSKNSNYSLAHVLYQKLGNDWYAFTEVDGDCFMTKVKAEGAAVEFSAANRELHEAYPSQQRAKRRAA